MSKNSVIFQVVYDGPALEGNEMSTRDLAPALIAITDLVEKANAILNGNQQKVQLNVKGAFKTGCFHIDLNLATSIIKSIFNALDNHSVNGALNLVQILGLVGVGSLGNSLIGIIKR